jgi:hypothetical protein
MIGINHECCGFCWSFMIWPAPAVKVSTVTGYERFTSAIWLPFTEQSMDPVERMWLPTIIN